jgi:hypothetical protein
LFSGFKSEVLEKINQRKLEMTNCSFNTCCSSKVKIEEIKWKSFLKNEVSGVKSKKLKTSFDDFISPKKRTPKKRCSLLAKAYV